MDHTIVKRSTTLLTGSSHSWSLLEEMFFDQTLLGDFSRADKIRNESFERAAKRLNVNIMDMSIQPEL